MTFRTRLTPSPFNQTPDQPKVAVAGGADAYSNTMQALAALDLTPAAGRKVLLKPNAGRVAASDSGIVTNPQVVAAAIDAFQAVGAYVSIGESPIAGVNTLEALAAAGITAVAAERNCPLIDMDARPPIDVPTPDATVLDALRICAEALEFDLVVSIPVMKMHMHTGVSLAIKNMKGCLWRRSKVKLHMLAPVPGRSEKPIDIAIADMARHLTPQLAIIDGTVGMEGLGPSAGNARKLGAVVVSADAFAADAVACQLMGLDAATVPHLRLGAANGCGIIDLAKITVTPHNWRQYTQAFAPPPTNLELAFPGVTILDRNSCSACQSTLLLFLKRYGDQIFDYFPPQTCINLAIGKGHETVPQGTLCIGNCAARHRGRGIFVPGCPPVASEILAAITGKPAVDVCDGNQDLPRD